MSVVVNFGAITTRNFQNNAGFFFGDNVLFDCDAHNKVNFATNGQITGNCVFAFTGNSITNDQDLADATIANPVGEIGAIPSIDKLF